MMPMSIWPSVGRVILVRDSINGGMAETAEMAETIGFQFAMFIATLILY